MLRTKLIILSLLLISVFLIILAFKADGKDENRVCLERSYELYKQNFMTNDGRIIDYERKDITTSEGQSYMMLRSLITKDKTTFDLVYQWTKNNLRRKDCLFAWLWGNNSKGQYEILDANSASDADIDIAFALLQAYELYKDDYYLKESLPIIQAIWNKETRTVNGSLILMPGVEQTLSEKIEINPSYFSPYAFKLFQKYDELHDWSLIVDSSYKYLEKSSKATKTGLFPDWFLIQDNKIVLEDSSRSDFSYDAVRVFPRIYLDYIETKDKRALAMLKKSEFFVNKWKTDKTMYTNYESSGKLRNKDKFIGSIAIIVPAIHIFDKKTALDIYNTELFNIIQSEDYWSNKNDYYGKNLAWFGLYLYQNILKKCELNKNTEDELQKVKK